MGVLAVVLVCTLGLVCCGVFGCAPAELPLVCGATENLL